MNDQPRNAPAAEIAAEMAATRAAYHRLLQRIPHTAWEAPTANPHWNVRQIMLHITLALQNLPLDISLIRRRRLIAPPGWLFNALNIPYTRWLARGHTRRSLAAKYDVDHERVLALLHTIRDEEWSRSGNYPRINENLPGGARTIRQMFHYLHLHFHEHAAEIPATLLTNDRSTEGDTMNEPVPKPDATPRPPTGWRRAMFRAPIYLYKAGLGWLLGSRFLLLNHTGRISGRARHAVLEVLDRDRARHHFLVTAGFGPRTQWYRNLLQTPRTTIQVGRRCWKATAVPLAPPDAGAAILAYARRYPRLFKELARVVGLPVDSADEAAVRVLGESGALPVIRLETEGAPTLAPLLPGTGWLAVALVAVGAGIAARILRRHRKIDED